MAQKKPDKVSLPHLAQQTQTRSENLEVAIKNVRKGPNQRNAKNMHTDRYTDQDIQSIINDILDLIPAHSHKSSTRYSSTYGGLVRSHYYIEQAEVSDNAVCRGYINPNAPKKVPSDRRKARTHTTKTGE